MTAKMSPRLVATAVAVALIGAAALVIIVRDRSAADRPPAYAVVAEADTSPTGLGDFDVVADSRIFFGHMSVGKNILAGLERLYAEHDVAPPTQVEITPGEVSGLPRGGLIVHSLIGENRDPLGKLANFDTSLRAGLAEQVDIAALKFCFVDVGRDTDVEGLFSAYQQTLAELQADYPEVRFVHMTVPLTTGPAGVKERVDELVGRDDNAARERYNALMRASYGPDELFDLASLEATEPDGVIRKAALFEGYTDDGGHLNAVGSARVATELVRFLADVAQ